MSKAQLIWDRSLPKLKEGMTNLSYTNWILPLEPITLVDNSLVLMAPDEFVHRTLTNLYTEQVSTAVSAANSGEYSVHFILPENRESYEEEPDATESSSMLSPKYTFDQFVVGESNRFAHAACVAVADHPATAYNPLFIYGGVGLGKTHLMQAIGHHILKSNPSARIIYVTSEAFTNELIYAIQQNRNKEFRNRYRNVDVLMVDDIQFIAGKNSAQEEFFHTFNSLFVANKQIILTSDRPPKEIPHLEARLYSRFECGLIADIQPPDFETRVAILRKKANNENLDVDDDVLYYIAERVKSNIRELEGSLTRVLAHALFDNSHINIELAGKALRDILASAPARKITPQLIAGIVADYYSVDLAEILGSRRDKKVAHPRQIAMYLSRKLTGCSLQEIGDAFGGKNHTTVIHAYDKICDMLEADPDLGVVIKDITGRVENG